jgi:hypothetical protein
LATAKPKKARPPAQKPTESVVSSAKADQTGVLIDELGSLRKELATPEAQDWIQKIARAEVISKAVRAAVPENTPGNQPFKKAGEKYIALLGPCGKQTVIDYTSLIMRIGAEEYARFAKASLKALEKNVKPGILAFYLSTAQTGTRTLTVIEKGGQA